MTGKMVAQQILKIFENTPKIFRYYDENESKYIDLAICADVPENGVSSYATIGLFQTDISLMHHANPLRIELLAACDQTIEDFSNMISTTALEIMDRHVAFPGYVVDNVVSMYMPNCAMRHILLTHPFLWENTHSLALEDMTLTWLMCIPVSDREKAYCEQNGLDALETVFEEQQIDVFNIFRPSAL